MSVEAIRSYLRRFSDTPIQDQRRHQRHACEIACYVLDEAGTAHAGTILDRSEAGVRVRCEDPGCHDTAAYLLRLDTGAVYSVKAVWSGITIGGYKLGRRVDLGPRPRAAGARAALAAWDEHRQAALSHTTAR